ncbi:MAG: polysaccharide lyase beta-sandwich domain-containing protein [Bacteroidales bacterium]|nr:polysaccharide lyase beta-sandwich domain-containing protein [Bacteroidales bacterium]
MKIYLKLSCALALLLACLPQVHAQDEFRKYAFDNYARYSSEALERTLGKEEKAGLKTLRERYASTAYRGFELRKVEMPVELIVANLDDGGCFMDLAAEENAALGGKDQDRIGKLLTEAFFRIWKVAEEFRADRYGFSLDKEVFVKCQKAILHYGDIEVSRSNRVHRFHASCFAVPTAAVNTYFCFYSQMEKVEAGKNKDAMLKDTHDMLMALGLQAWTQPLRNDFTDEDVVQVERFRNHVWWVGGNALAYRSLLPVAAMYRSVEMIEVLSEVAQRGIGRTSQHTYGNAFWTEGCTEDGAGWGHGMQCLVWGYPIDGNLNAMAILTSLQGSPWANKLSEDNVQTLFNFIQGSSWYYYKGYILPYLDRGTAEYKPETRDIRSISMVRQMIKDWADSFTGKQRSELIQFTKEAEKRNINMDGYAPGVYSGTRWFFNNDDLIKKNSRYHIMVNMSSVRCDGIESAADFADAYNFYPTDGMTLFQRKGNEYAEMAGAWDITATPGVTAREGMDRITPVTNWRGYCSMHNFAGAATAGGENAVAGYVFEKMNASLKENVNDKGNNNGKNPVLYGVKAYKSYFMLGDYMVALGAGITNLDPDQEGTVRTTIDNTRRDGNIIAVQDGKQMPAGEGTWSFNVGGKPVWVMQEGQFSYTILPEFTENACFSLETLKTDWAKYNAVNKGKKNLPSEVNALRLWVDHGRNVVDGTYGYVVYAGEGAPSGSLPFRVLRNDKAAQAVESMDGKVVEAVFYDKDAAVETAGGTLTVSSPCVVMIDGDMLSITDATMDAGLAEITVYYNGQAIPVAMPQGGLCGKSVTVNLR